MKIYLAGPMRGKKDFNFPLFIKRSAQLRQLGHEVFNPAERDLKKYGSKLKSETGNEDDIKNTGFSLRDALGADLAWICKHAEAIAVLPGWRKSKGAKAEVATAKALGLIVKPIKEFLDA